MIRLNEFTKMAKEHTGNKSVAFVYVNMNPIVPQEVKLIEEAKTWAKYNHADVVVYSPVVHDTKMNPLMFSEKEAFAKKLFGVSLKESNTIQGAIGHIAKSGYKTIRAFVTEDVIEATISLFEQHDISLDNSYVASVNSTRKAIMENLSEGIYVGISDDDYEKAIRNGALTSLKESRGYVPKPPIFPVGYTVGNIVNGDIVRVIANGERVLCESLITGTPQWYSPFDLVGCDDFNTVTPNFDTLISQGIEDDLLTEIFDTKPDTQLNIRVNGSVIVKAVRLSKQESLLILIQTKILPPIGDYGGKRMRVDFTRVKNEAVGGDLINTLKEIDINGTHDNMVEFINSLKDETKATDKISGGGIQFKIFSIVMAAIQENVAALRPNTVNIVARRDEPSRIELYKKMMSKFGKNMMEIEPDEKDGSDKVAFLVKV